MLLFNINYTWPAFYGFLFTVSQPLMPPYTFIFSGYPNTKWRWQGCINIKTCTNCSKLSPRQSNFSTSFRITFKIKSAPVLMAWTHSKACGITQTICCVATDKELRLLIVVPKHLIKLWTLKIETPPKFVLGVSSDPSTDLLPLHLLWDDQLQRE